MVLMMRWGGIKVGGFGVHGCNGGGTVGLTTCEAMGVFHYMSMGRAGERFSSSAGWPKARTSRTYLGILSQ